MDDLDHVADPGSSSLSQPSSSTVLPIKDTPSSETRASSKETTRPSAPESDASPPVNPLEQPGIPVDSVYENELKSKVNQWLHWKYEGFPGSQSVLFDASTHLSLLMNEDYYVCEKKQGNRYLILMMMTPKGPASFMINRRYSFLYVPLTFPLPHSMTSFHHETLIDGELVVEVVNDKKSTKFLACDLIVANGINLSQRSFSTRLGILQQDIIKPFQSFVSQHPELKLPFSVDMKRQERSYGMHLIFADMMHKSHQQGLLFTPVRLAYVPGTSHRLQVNDYRIDYRLQWTSPEHVTADFKIKVTWTKDRKPQYEIWVSQQAVHVFYDHLTLEPDLAERWRVSSPDGRVAEFRYDSEWNTMVLETGYAPSMKKGGWRFVRFRDDKDKANDEKVVKQIVALTHQGITKEQLLAAADRMRHNWKAREKGLVITTKGTQPLGSPVYKPPPSAYGAQPSPFHRPSGDSSPRRRSSEFHAEIKRLHRTSNQDVSEDVSRRSSFQQSHMGSPSHSRHPSSKLSTPIREATVAESAEPQTTLLTDTSSHGDQFEMEEVVEEAGHVHPSCTESVENLPPTTSSNQADQFEMEEVVEEAGHVHPSLPVRKKAAVNNKKTPSVNNAPVVHIDLPSRPVVLSHVEKSHQDDYDDYDEQETSLKPSSSFLNQDLDDAAFKTVFNLSKAESLDTLSAAYPSPILYTKSRENEQKESTSKLASHSVISSVDQVEKPPVHDSLPLINDPPPPIKQTMKPIQDIPSHPLLHSLDHKQIPHVPYSKPASQPFMDQPRTLYKQAHEQKHSSPLQSMSLPSDPAFSKVSMSPRAASVGSPAASVPPSPRTSGHRRDLPTAASYRSSVDPPFYHPSHPNQHYHRPFVQPQQGTHGPLHSSTSSFAHTSSSTSSHVTGMYLSHEPSPYQDTTTQEAEPFVYKSVTQSYSRSSSGSWLNLVLSNKPGSSADASLTSAWNTDKSEAEQEQDEHAHWNKKARFY